MISDTEGPGRRGGPPPARRRLPEWGDRLWVGNALDWTAPGGRLLASSYVPVRDRSRHADRLLRRLCFPVDGLTEPASPAQAPTAWVRRR